MSDLKNKVIIWAADDYNALGLLRQLGENGVDVFYLISGARGYASQSRYCTSSKTVSSKEEGRDFLLNHFADEPVKPIIITSGDGISVFMDQNRDSLGKYFILPTTSVAGMHEKYTDKNNMTRLAEKLGFLCPQSRFVKYDSSLDGVIYPCIIKPSHQTPGHHNEFKYKICRDEEALKKTLSIVRPESEFILQQYVEKDCDALVYGGRMRDGETLIAGAYLRDRMTANGESSHGKITSTLPESISAELIDNFLSEIDYYGLFSFEYAMKGGIAYFLEVNLRNDGTSHFFYQAGANLPLAYAYSCAGLDYSDISTKVSSERMYIDELFDFENVISGNVKYKKWYSELKEADVFKFYDLKDIEPWKYMKIRKWIKIIRDMSLVKIRPYYVYLVDNMKNILTGGGKLTVEFTHPVVAYC